MANFFRELRPYPGRWIGVHVAYSATIVEFFKKSCPMKAWDAATKTWWFPESYEPIISAELVRAKLITPEQAKAFSKDFYAHQKLGKKEEPYAILGINVGAPRGFVDLAYNYWRRQFQNAGGAGTQLEEVEHAYREIIGEAG